MGLESLDVKRQVDIAWAAGLFEGEGSTVLKEKRGEGEHFCVSLTSTDFDVLEKFQTIMGGKIYEVKSANKPAHYKPARRWAVQSKPEVARCLFLLVPHLCSRRRDKAVEVIMKIAASGDGRRRDV